MKKILACLTFIVSVITVNGLNASPIWQQLLKGSYSLVQDRQFWVVRSAEGFQALQRETGMGLSPNVTLPDFEQFMLVAVFYGQKPTGGYSIDVDAVEISETVITINVREQIPGKDVMVTQALTSPFVFVVLPKSDKRIAVNYIR